MPRILIVDDEPVILSVLKSILTAPDREFLTAGTATNALQQAMQVPSLEVALVDKNLPDRTGLDVARELKHLHPDIEVILLTAYASLDSAIEAIKVGAFDYISKPIEDFDDLNLKVYNASEKVRLKREQRKLLDRFAESEERYRGVFQASSDAIIVCDAETGRIQDANAAAQKLYGYTRDELCQLSLGDLRAEKPEGAPAAADGPRVEQHLRKDKSKVAVEITCGQFVFQRRGTHILVLRDVGDRERASLDRAALENNLRQAQKMDAIGRLAGGVAHDFNNLLTVILGNAELMLREMEGQPLSERAREVMEAAQRAARLTRQLLAISRKKPAKLDVIVLNDVVTEMQKMLRRTIGENIELLVSNSPDLWRVRADPDQMGQVLLNLVVNARDAMPKGGKLMIETANVTLDAHAGAMEAGLTPGRYVRMAVSDTGVGMTKEIQGRLFEPYFTTKEPGKGTGLGLATVYGIVQQVGGTVRAYSEPGRGSTFKVYLPLCGEALESEKSSAARAQKRGNGETILVAEDEETVRKLIARVLTDRGYKVIEGANGEEALEMGRAHPEVSLLLTDLVMPKMSGRDLAVRLTELRPNLRVLYMSAYADQAIEEQGALPEPDLFLHKPFTEDRLLSYVAESLAGD